MYIRHEVLKGKISKVTFSLLKWLYSVEIQEMENDLSERINGVADIHYVISNDLQYEDLKLKKEILYLRYCTLVEQLCEEYKELEDTDRKEVIDYYVFDNSLKELNFLGLGFYYDCKYKRNKATIYKGRFKDVNWNQVCNSESVKNKVGADAVKEMVKACRKHINIGGDIQLRSFSKCFIIDLFKYVSLYNHTDGKIAADIYVKKDADINIIQVNNMPMSLQKYITNKIILSNTQFAIDFSEPRNYNRENFDRWYKNFMGTDFSEDKNESIDETEIKSNDEYIRDYVSSIIYRSENEKQVSLMVSPVADREVVVSGDLWKVVDYDVEDEQPNNCIHFCFNEAELYELIICYFIHYYRLKRNLDEIDLSVKFKNNLLNVLDLLKKELSKGNETDLAKDLENKIDYIKKIVELDIQNEKIAGLLAMIDWDYEKKYWEEGNVKKLSYNRIYNKNKENLLANVLKCMCIDVVKGI